MWQVKAVVGVAAIAALLMADWKVGNDALPLKDQVSFPAYLASWADAAGAVVGSSDPVAADAALAAALPAAPKGWKRSETTPEDVAAMLVPEAQAVLAGGGGKPGEDARLLAAVGRGTNTAGAVAAAFTYSYGKDRVVVELVRYPDTLFQGNSGIRERMALQTWVMDHGAQHIGAVGGMPVWQARVVPGLGAGMAIATIAGQVRVRVVHSARVSPERVLAILSTLDVAALNRDVVLPDAAITAATAPEPAAGPAEDAGMIAAVTGMLFGQPSAAKPTNAPKVVLEPVATAEDLGKTGMKPASEARVGAMAARGERHSSVGIGSCGERGAGKFCSVTEKE